MIEVKSNVTTIELTGSEEKVQFAVPYPYYWALNTSGADMYMSISEGITANADGVVTIPAGGASCTMHGTTIDTVHLLGTGSCLIMGTYSAFCPFKAASGGGDSGGGSSGEVKFPKILSGTVALSSANYTPTITFSEPFESVPIVLVSYSADVRRTQNRVFSGYAYEVSNEKFTAEITSYYYSNSSNTGFICATVGTLDWIAIGT